MADKIDHEVFEKLIGDTVDEIDILATHYWVEDVSFDNPTVLIGSSEIRYGISGTISVVLQYGSDGDYGNDMGARHGATFPFQCTITSPLDDPSTIEIEPLSLLVDTDNFFEE